MMKKSLIFATALALAFGAGAAVSAHQGKAAKVSAEPELKTLYCKMEYGWWKADDAAIALYAWDGDDSSTINAMWPGERMTTIDGGNTWRGTVDTSLYDKVIFVRVNGSGDVLNWGAKTADLDIPTDDKDLYTITSSTAVWGDPGVTGEWSKYVPGYSVTTHIRGVTSQISVEEGQLPASPSLHYGESSFVGWFDNEACSEGHEVTAITSNGDVYAKFEMAETHSYTLDLSAVSATYTDPHLFAWDANGNNGDFPGVAIVNDTFTVPEGAQIVISSQEAAEGRKQTVDISQPLNPVADEALVICSDETEGKNNAYWAKDEEALDGYYLVGTKNNYKFRDATLIPEIVKDTDFNVAVLLTGYTAEVDEKVTIRQAKSNVTTWIHSGDPYKDEEGQKAYGYREGDDFKFTVAGSYDIFVHEDAFFVAPHANRHYVSISNVLLEGSFRRDTVARPATIATEGTPFNPGVYDVEGYHQEEYFTDEDCIHKYTPTEITTDDVQLYCKYMKVGYYVISGEGEWAIENAILMDSPDNPNNKAEASIRVFNVGDTYSFVYYDGQKHGHAGLGANYEFVVNEEDHIKFTKVGNYVVYWSNVDNKLYVNAGLEAFYTSFLNSVGGACHSDGIYAEGELQAVRDAWELQKAAYNALTTEEQNTIKVIGFDTKSESQDQSVRMVKMYSYIVKKYGTDTAHGGFEDFIWGQNHTPTNPFRITPTADGNTYLTSIIVLASVVTVSIGAFFIFRKRRHE
jgi:hypothetical protein